MTISEIITTILGSGFFSVMVTSIVSKSNNSKNAYLKYITKERGKWREDIRNIVVALERIKYYKNNKHKLYKLSEELTKLKVRINPNGKDKNTAEGQDRNLWEHIDNIEKWSKVPANEEVDWDSIKAEIDNLIFDICKLLKSDWERSKIEVKGNYNMEYKDVEESSCNIMCKQSIISFISTIVFFLLAHGYRFSNLLFSHDSLNVCEYKPEWELGIGRFMQPVLYVIRGVLGAPWLFSILSIIWLSLSVLFIIKIFNIDSLWAVIATSGIMVCNNVITLSNATYIQWMDVYTLALFTAVLAAWLLLKSEDNKLIQIRNYVLAAVLVAISMGLYQAYIGVTLGIIVFAYILKLGNNEPDNSIKSLFIGIIKSCIPILIGGILYLILWKAILALSGVSSQNYFGMDESLSAKGYTYAFYRTYKNVAIFFRRPSLYNTGSVIGTRIIESVIVIANIIVLVILGLYPIVNYISCKKKQINSKSEGIIRLALQYILLAILPFAVNFACFMTKGDEHDLMRYGMVMIYVYAITIICNNKSEKEKRTIRANTISLICLSIVIWSNIVFSNQLYLKKSLQEEATNYKIGRLVEMIENTAESANLERPYKVIIVGNVSDNDYFNDIKDTEMLGGTGIYDSPITYGRTIGFYMNYMLGANMNVYLLDKDDNYYLVGDDETNWNPSPIINQELEDMSIFPNDGSIVSLKNYIVVKLSDTQMVY